MVTTELHQQEASDKEYNLDPRSWFSKAIPDDPMRQINRTYGIDNPMPMIMREAPGAGVDAHTVWEAGKPTEEPLLSPTEIVTSVDTAIRNTFAFVQVSGKAAGGENVANISTGLTSNRQDPMEDSGRDIIKAIGGENVKLFWFGPNKLIGIVETDQAPEETMYNLVQAPRKAYEEHHPTLSYVQNEIQDIRERDVLLDKGQKFADHFYGRDDSFKRAHQDDGGMSFEWLYLSRGDQLWGVNLDHQPQSVTSIALHEYTDPDTRNMLLAMQEFFEGNSSKNRYFIEFNFGPDVACCNVSSNTQYSHAMGDSLTTELKRINGFGSLAHLDSIRVINSLMEDQSYCKSCYKEHGDCNCVQEEAVAQAG